MASEPDGSWVAVVGPDEGLDVGRLAGRLRRAPRPDDLLAGFSHVAVASWDATDRRLTLARCPGAAPTLHVRQEADHVEFAERLSDLVRPGDRVDRVGLAARLAAGKPLTRTTLVQGIDAVAPGEVVRLDAEGRSTAWLTPPDWPESAQGLDRPARLARLRQAFTDVLGRTVEDADEPVLGLSGGIDSTIIAVALAAWLGVRPITYTVRFPEYDGPYDEFEDADTTARALGLVHETVVLRPTFIADHLDWMATWFEGPVGYAVHTADLAAVAHGDLLLSGAGGDSWSLSRNQRHGLALGRALPSRVARLVRSGAARAADLGVRGAARARDVADYAGALPRAMTLHAAGGLSAGLVDDLLGPDASSGRAVVADFNVERESHVASLDAATRLKYLNGFMSGPATGADWVLRWSRAYGMRPGLPFYEPALNRRLATMVVDPGDRVELRDLAAEHLPAEAAYRKKVAQSVPLAAWFRGPLRELTEETLSSTVIAGDGVFDPAAVRRLLDEHMAGRADHHWALLSLMTFSRWKRLALDPQSR